MSPTQLSTLALAREGGFCNTVAAPETVNKVCLLLGVGPKHAACFLASNAQRGSVRGKTKTRTPEGLFHIKGAVNFSQRCNAVLNYAACFLTGTALCGGVRFRV